MKGVSLPINTIVVVAIAVLVMMVIAGFFVGGFQPTSQIPLSTAIANACDIARTTYNCAEVSLVSARVTYTKAGEEEPAPVTLGELCTISGIAEGPEFSKQCLARCGC
ncbi:MAG: hypothetical protein J4431_04375 [Candidatus Aenigmarchaeota archaeon]|nr:hypothetical protein [Candidatus Aenigmarchaeota archaeon]